MKKRALSILLVLCLMLTLIPANILAGNDSADTKTEAADDATDSIQSVVEETRESEPMQEDSTELFAVTDELVPGEDGTMTRAEWLHNLAVVFEMSVDEDNLPDNYYSDLTEKHAYYQDILLAVGFGLVDIPAGEEFRPDEPATREFAAHTLNFCLSFQLDDESAYTFDEQNEVTYADDVQVAINRGWLALVDGKFLPEKAITGAEATAMLADAAAVMGTVVADPNYDSVYKFVDGVIVIPDGTEVSVADHVVTIQNCPKEIAAGNIFAVYLNGIPSAFSAASVTKDGSATIIAATAVEDSEVFKEIDAQGEIDVQFTQFEALEGTEITYIDETTGIEYQNAEAAERAVRRAAGTKEIKRTLSKTEEIKLGDGISASVKVKISNPKIKYNINTKTKSAFATLEGKTDVSYEIKCDSAAAIKDVVGVKDFELLSCKVPNVGGLIVYLDLSTAGTLQGTQSGNLMTGIQYSAQDGFRLMKNFEASNFSLTLECRGKLGVGVKLGVTELPVLKAYVYAQMGATGLVKDVTYNDEQLPKECAHFAAYLYADYGATASIKFFGVSQEFKYEVSPWNENNSPVRVVHHYEDGKEVSKCSRGYDFSYFTTGFSKYWGSGWSGGSSAWGLNAAGEPIEIYKYTTDDDGNATITGFYGNATALIIPATLDGHPVVAIGNNAFKNLTQIRVVTIPEGIRSIGDSAFYGCKNLSTVNFPESLTSIGESAFYQCISLTNVTLPKNLKTLAGFAFGRCTNLQYVFIPKSITNCSEAFEQSGFTVYYGGPFYLCSSLRSVQFADGITNLPENLFYGCTGLIELDIPNTVTVIHENVFKNCSNLTNVDFPESLTSIESNAFLSCLSLEEAILPAHLNQLSGMAFAKCTSLSHVFIPKTIKECPEGYYQSGFNVYYGGPFYLCSALTNVEFAEGTNNIPANLFYQCTGLKEVNIPDTVTVINENAFRSCVNLENVTFPESLTAIEYNAFQACSSLKEANLPTHLTRLCGMAFARCTSLAHVFIPKSITDAPEGYEQVGINLNYGGPFFLCSSLNSVEFEDGITVILPKLFKYCTGLEEIEIPDTVTTIETEAFNNCYYLSKITLPEGLRTLNAAAFRDCIRLTDVVIPNSVTSMGSHVFYGCTSLKSVVLPSTRVNIMKYTFYNCSALTDIMLPDTVTNIQEKAFYGCTALESLELPGGLTTIGNDAFYNCDSLAQIVIPDNVTMLGNSAFNSCDNLQNVTLSSSLTTIPASCFKDCPALETIVIPKGVTAIKNSAFMNDTGLTSATIPVTVTSIESNGFSYSDRMTVYGCAGTYAETYANDMGFQFADITNPIEGFELAGGADTVVLDRYQYFTPEYTILAADASVETTDALTYSFSNTNAKLVGKQIYGQYAGECVVTVTATSGVTYTFTVVVRATQTLAVTTLPAKTSYAYGEALDTTGMVVTANYANGDVGAVTNYTVSGYDPNTYGEQTVTVSYGGKTTSFKVTVVDDRVLLSGISVTTPPDKTVYVKGDAIDYTGIGITATYTDGSTQEIPASDCTFSGFNRLKVGTQTITVTYQGQTATFDVTVVAETHIHAYTDAVTAPTCTEQGYTTHTCACGDSYVDTYVDALGHKSELKNAKASTCAEAGYTGDEICTRCGETVKQGAVIAALGHKWDNGKVTTAPTATTDGVKTFTCTVCGETKTETIPKLTHTHSYTAVVTAPTCTEQGYTTHTCTCGDSYVDSYVDALGHKTELKNAKAATCIEAGYTGDEICTRCGETIKKGEVLAALGHKWDNGKVTTEPTATTDGVKTYTCTVCGETKTEAIPATGKEPVDPTTVFTDVTHNWAYDGISYCYNNGLMAGMTDTTFEPDGTLTRGQLVAILWRQAGEPKPQTNCAFTDLTMNYYRDAIAWAAENGIVAGRDAAHFDPDSPISRQDTAAILYRYTKDYLKLELSSPADISVFPDSGTVSNYAREAMAWANAAGIISGDKRDGVVYLDPKGNATRAQAARILMVFCEDILQ